jgi:hypothetical protein
MAERIAELYVDIEGRVGNLERALKTAETRTTQASKRISNTMNSLKGAMLGAFSAVAIAGAVKKGVQAFLEFNKGMQNVNTIINVSKTQLKKYGDEVLALSTKLGVGTKDLTGAFYQVTSAGVQAGDAIKYLDVASRSAIAGLTSTEVAVDGLTTVMNAFKIDAKDVEKTADQMFTTVRLGKTTFEELASSYSTVANIASVMGVGFEEVSAMVATLTKQGTPTSVAMTQIRGALIGVNKELGDGWRNTYTLQEAFGKMLEIAGGSQNKLKEMIGRIEGVNAIVGVTGQNFQMASDDIRQMQDSLGALGVAYDVQTQSWSHKIEKAQTAIENALIKTVEYAIPLLESYIDVWDIFLADVDILERDLKRLTNEYGAGMEKGNLSLERQGELLQEIKDKQKELQDEQEELSHKTKETENVFSELFEMINWYVKNVPMRTLGYALDAVKWSVEGVADTFEWFTSGVKDGIYWLDELNEKIGGPFNYRTKMSIEEIADATERLKTKFEGVNKFMPKFGGFIDAFGGSVAPKGEEKANVIDIKFNVNTATIDEIEKRIEALTADVKLMTINDKDLVPTLKEIEELSKKIDFTEAGDGLSKMAEYIEGLVSPMKTVEDQIKEIDKALLNQKLTEGEIFKLETARAQLSGQMVRDTEAYLKALKEVQEIENAQVKKRSEKIGRDMDIYPNYPWTGTLKDRADAKAKELPLYDVDEPDTKIKKPEIETDEERKKNNDEITNSMTRQTDLMNRMMGSAFAIQNAFHIAGNTFYGQLVSALEVANQIANVVSSVIGIFSSAFDSGSGGIVGLITGLFANKGGEFKGTPRGVVKMAGGGSFVVPQGYPNDSFPMMVESGERVSVTSKAGMTSGTGETQMLNKIVDSIQALNKNFISKDMSTRISANIDGLVFTQNTVNPNQKRLMRLGKGTDEV